MTSFLLKLRSLKKPAYLFIHFLTCLPFCCPMSTLPMQTRFSHYQTHLFSRKSYGFAKGGKRLFECCSHITIDCFHLQATPIVLRLEILYGMSFFYLFRLLQEDSNNLIKTKIEIIKGLHSM